MLPNFIGIGAPKAGTTWLARCLGEHPQVFVAKAKEVCFLDYGDIEGRLPEYEEHFVGSEGAAAVGEFTTRYLASERPAPRIRTLLPNARLIVALRNPVDQVYSHYWHLARQNFHSWGAADLPRSFEEALEQHEHKLLPSAFYFQHLSRWLTMFEREQLLIVLYDDIRDRPAAVLHDAYEFLGVNADFTPPSVHDRSSDTRQGVSPRGGVTGRIYRRLYDGLNRRVYHPLKRRLGVARATRIKEALRVRQMMERVFFKTGYPPMAANTRRLLAERFAEDIRGVAELTRRDLSHWK